MRVLQLGPYPPPWGGVQTNLVAIRRLLRERGIPCAVVNLTRFRKTPGDDVYYPRNAVELLGLLLRLEYDVAHLHVGGNVTGRLLALGLVLCAIPRARAVLTLHSGGFPRSEAGRRAGRFGPLGFVLRRFDRVIAVNQEILELFRRVGVPDARARLILPYPAVAAAPDEPLPDRMVDFRRRHRPCLVAVGLLEPQYDLPLQLEALGRVRGRFPDAGLLIVGAGSLEADLRRLIDRLTYAEHVLLCGDVPHPLVLRLIAEADLFLRTTRYDGDSISVREALQLGTPVVATDNGMRPAGVDLVPTGDLGALVAAIERRLGAPAAPRRASPADERNLEAVLDLYAELASRTARR
jgi:glycogen(starch) synthase